jgi:tRNA pseudouridine55 synthase
VTTPTADARTPPRGSKRRGTALDGFLILDKPTGITSTTALGRARRALGATKAGHCGTLDPLASGVLVLAFGEATKLVSVVMEGRKTYRFGVRWGETRDSDDADGALLETSAVRPARAALEAALPRFLGVIAQRPPAYSAIKRDGRPAYDRARAGETVELEPRAVRIDRLELLDAERDRAVLELDCGKGTYVRALARDLAQALGTLGFVDELRRLAVGPFRVEGAISLANLESGGYSARAHLQPVETVLDDIPALAVTEAEARAIRQGRSVPMPHAVQQVPAASLSPDRLLGVTENGRLVALGRIEAGELRAVRVLNRKPEGDLDDVAHG